MEKISIWWPFLGVLTNMESFQGQIWGQKEKTPHRSKGL